MIEIPLNHDKKALIDDADWELVQETLQHHPDRELIMATVHSEIKVCTDCIFVLSNGVENDEQDTAACLMADRWEGHDVVPGGAHVEGCDYEDCYCGDKGFSWSPCEGCGSSLGGDRFAATVFYRE